MKTTKTNLKTKNAYFDWLYHQVEEDKSAELEDFIFDLYLIPFYCVIPNDDNRAEDGIVLRDTFIVEKMESNYTSANELVGPCTILEMLVALANRMDYILYDPSKGNRYSKWFWLFIDNLKLQKYRNGDKEANVKKNYNRIIIKKFVKRQYQSDGKGGLFPLNSPNCDQRNVEIWYQMMDYIGENYDI